MARLTPLPPLRLRLSRHPDCAGIIPLVCLGHHKEVLQECRLWVGMLHFTVGMTVPSQKLMFLQSLYVLQKWQQIIHKINTIKFLMALGGHKDFVEILKTIRHCYSKTEKISMIFYTNRE